MKDMSTSESKETQDSPPTTSEDVERPKPPPFKVDYDLISYIEKGQKPIRPPSKETGKNL